MNCYYHSESNAVATCTNCGKGLCKQCTDRFNIPICESCCLSALKEEKKVLMHPLKVLGIAFFIILFLLLPFLNYISLSWSGFFGFLIIFYFFAAMLYGFSSIRQNSNVIVERRYSSLSDQAVHDSTQMGCAAIIGIFVMPFKIKNDMKRYKEVCELEESILQKHKF